MVITGDYLTKGIIFYTANEVSPKIAGVVRENLRIIARRRDMPIICSSLKQKLDFGDINLSFPELKRSPLSQFKQILAALEKTDADIVFFCEDDILYHDSHFDYIPPTNQAYYYNTNIWKLWLKDGIATHEDVYMPLSGLCGYKDLLLGHYQRRVAKILQNQKDILAKGGVVKNEGYSKHMGYEPGGHMEPRGVDKYPMVAWQSAWPLVDIRHGNNLTKGKRRPSDYHDPKWAAGWQESDEIPWWGKVTDLVSQLQ